MADRRLAVRTSAVPTLRIRRVFTFVLIGCALLTSSGGCASAELEISRASLAGNDILVELRSYTRTMPFYAHMATITDSRYYLLRFSLASGKAGTSQCTGIAELPQLGGLNGCCSADRPLFIAGPGPLSPERDWTVELMEWADPFNVRKVSSWHWKRNEVKSPPFAISSDGRYLALPGSGARLLDLSNLHAAEKPGVAGMFEAAATAGAELNQWFVLTPGLNYLIFKPSSLGPTGSATFAADGTTYSRKWYSAFIDQRGRSAGAFPDQLKPDARPPTLNFFAGAAESSGGDLLLMYRQLQPNLGELYIQSATGI
jgi:hypothetical protein